MLTKPTRDRLHAHPECSDLIVNSTHQALTHSTPRRMLLVGYPARLCFYAACTALLMHLVLQLVSLGDLKTLSSENGPIEVSQIVVLILAGLLAGIASTVSKENRTLNTCLAVVFLCAAGREADDWFATYFFDDAYKWLVCLPLMVLAAFLCWKSRTHLYYEMITFLSKPHATLIIFSILMVVTLGQTLDRSSFWPNVDSSPSLGNQKAVVEETLELFAYLTLLFGANELLVHTLLQRRTRSNRDNWTHLISRWSEEQQEGDNPGLIRNPHLARNPTPELTDGSVILEESKLRGRNAG